MRPTTTFPYLLWHLTNADESLFSLSPEELFLFSLIAKAHYAQP